MRAVRVVAHGVVQGVGFREGMRRHAERVGVRGWVRNCDDGTVEALVEGDDAAVDAVVEWLRGGGPRGAVVERVAVSDASAGGAAGFHVR